MHSVKTRYQDSAELTSKWYLARRCLVFLFLCTVLHVNAQTQVPGGERWLELRCSDTVRSTSYVVPEGMVVQVMAYKAPNDSLVVSMDRPEGKVDQASSFLMVGTFIMGPANIEMRWLGFVDAKMPVHICLFREFPAVTPPLQVHLEAATELPNFRPAAVFFRSKQ